MRRRNGKDTIELTGVCCVLLCTARLDLDPDGSEVRRWPRGSNVEQQMVWLSSTLSATPVEIVQLFYVDAPIAKIRLTVARLRTGIAVVLYFFYRAYFPIVWFCRPAYGRHKYAQVLKVPALGFAVADLSL